MRGLSRSAQSLAFGKRVKLEFAALVPQPDIGVRHRAHAHRCWKRCCSLYGAFNLPHDIRRVRRSAHPVEFADVASVIQIYLQHAHSVHQRRHLAFVDAVTVVLVNMLGSVLAVVFGRGGMRDQGRRWYHSNRWRRWRWRRRWWCRGRCWRRWWCRGGRWWQGCGARGQQGGGQNAQPCPGFSSFGHVVIVAYRGRLRCGGNVSHGVCLCCAAGAHWPSAQWPYERMNQVYCDTRNPIFTATRTLLWASLPHIHLLCIP